MFPEGTPGLALDTLARAPLWSIGLNYRHGTGHGVGAALNVHEGPQSISARCVCTSTGNSGQRYRMAHQWGSPRCTGALHRPGRSAWLWPQG